MHATLTLNPDALHPDTASRETDRSPDLDFSPGLRVGDPVLDTEPPLAAAKDPLAREHGPPGKRVILALAVAMLVGVGGTLAWQSQRATPAPAPAAPVIPPELVQQLDSIRRDVAAARQGLSELTASQQQLAQNIAKLHAGEQEILKKVSAAPPARATSAAPSRPAASHPAALGAPPRSLGTLPASPQPAGSQAGPQPGALYASPLPPPQTIPPPR